MKISLDNLGKRYHKKWIFRGLSLKCSSGESYAITGPNGSGKSTLLKIIGSYLEPSEGTISYYLTEGHKLDESQVLSRISLATPYLNLISELTLSELLEFHYQFREASIPISEILDRMELAGALHQRLEEFSSGMAQRVRLALALYTQSELILLDEPTSNLDEQGIEWYLREMKSLLGSKTIIIASNQRYEYDFVEKSIHLTEFK